ncbi:MAG: CvpA family protein [Snodgrassella sp.]|uniref:CvpA family protein n=1 Tax=Snodgrassella TaxID=1193515 RepID=UPI0008157045|nr:MULTISPECIES: CvpA family protein [Snodgrassella]MCO6506568.1 CvpA family protein [Snodgrassella sp.]MCO6507702.1 CvpA family protein [Snodgrassella sp.]MCO6514099.1 CvpA family protein [Snodgrassella sp.]MCO6515397.1 CvpA family protein [Snodgrassella sp.]MCO6518371.1 CvpA family protein [Snodgrassella sp.]
MTVFDVLSLGLILLTTLVAMMRGLVGEIASLLCWVVAFIGAKVLAVPVANLAFTSMQPQALATSLSFVLVFGALWIVQRLLRALITSALQTIGLGGVNRILGACFGAVKGVIIVTLVVLICTFTDLPKSPMWRNSVTAGMFEQLAMLAVPYLPAFLADKLNSPSV